MDGRAEYAVDGVAAGEVVRPGSQEEVAAALKRAAEAGRTALPVGQGTRLGLGAPVDQVDTVLETTALTRVVTYEPPDLTATIETGLPLAELGRTLAAQGQRLPLQAYRGRGTVGGLIATGADGALELRSGRARDLLIGAKVALTDGTLAKGRGAVVKNVAGYDVPRLLAGSFGTLGVVVEASFRLEPLPEREATAVFAFATLDAAFDAARRAFDSPIEPSFLNVLSDARAHRLAAGFDGSAARVDGQVDRLVDLLAPVASGSAGGPASGGEPSGREVLDGEANSALRRALDDPIAHLGAAAAAGNAPTNTSTGSRARIVLRLTAEKGNVPFLVSAARRAAGPLQVDARPACGVAFVAFEAGGTDPAVETIAAVRSATGVAAGTGAEPRAASVVVVSAPLSVRRAVDVWGPPPADLDLMRTVKAAFDPAGALVAGRFVGGL